MTTTAQKIVNPNHIGRDVFRETKTGTFECPRGHLVEIPERSRKGFETGHAVLVRCEVCDASGTVQSDNVEPSVL